jgi:hypothetical protein
VFSFDSLKTTTVEDEEKASQGKILSKEKYKKQRALIAYKLSSQ